MCFHIAAPDWIMLQKENVLCELFNKLKFSLRFIKWIVVVVVGEKTLLGGELAGGELVGGETPWWRGDRIPLEQF